MFLKAFLNSRKSSYTFPFYNGFCKVCKKNNLSPLCPLKGEENEEIKLIHNSIMQSCSNVVCMVLKVEGVNSIKMNSRENGAMYV